MPIPARFHPLLVTMTPDEAALLGGLLIEAAGLGPSMRGLSSATDVAGGLGGCMHDD